jgi:hypothetical protein
LKGFIDKGDEDYILPDFSPFLRNPKQTYQELTKFPDFAEMNSVSLVQDAVQVSSEDNNAQKVQNILNESNSFWSSKGSPDKTSSEFIVFKLHNPSAICQVGVTPYKAFYQAGQPTYAPLTITVLSGFSEDKFIFASEPFPIKNSSGNFDHFVYCDSKLKSLFLRFIDIQYLDLQSWMCVGTYVKLVLNGRRQTQPGDNLWYTVLQHICITGIEIGILGLKKLSVKLKANEGAIYHRRTLLSFFETMPFGFL